MDDAKASRASSSSGFEDKTLTCRDCGQEFVWTAGEQQFYQEKGLESAPGRCLICRAKRKAQRRQFGGMSGGRTETQITCSKCGKIDTVPFVPRDPKTVLCRDCYRQQQQQRRAG
jgi:CxxC-x17-CxxC domain-containing protein